MNLSSPFPVVPLGDIIAESQYGTSSPATTEPGGFPILRMNNITAEGRMDLTDLKWIELPEGDIEKYTVRRGDLLFNRTNSRELVGKTAVWDRDERYAFAGYLIRVRFDPVKAEPQYVSAFLNSPIGKAILFAKAKPSVNMSNISASDMRRLPIPLPPLPEQKRIAAILDKADGIRRKRREALCHLGDLYQSAFCDLFGHPVRNERGWPRRRLDQIVENIDSGWSPVCLDRPVEPGEWGVLKLGAVTYCRYQPGENKALPSGLEPPSALEVKRGDLLMTRKNTYDLVAACAYVWETPPRLLLPDLIFRFRLREDAHVLPEYLWGLFTHPAKRRTIQSLAGGTAGSMPNISKGRLLTQEIELPPLADQQRYARIVHHANQCERQFQESLTESEALFDSLVQRAFRGEL